MSGYRLDSFRNMWVFERFSSKGKVKMQPLALGFSVKRVDLFNAQPDGLQFARITYEVDYQTFRVFMPGKDYNEQRFDRYMTKVTRLPGCSRRQLNDLVAWLLQCAPRYEIQMFTLQGWNEGNKHERVFAAFVPQFDVPENWIPRSIRKRQHFLPGGPPNEIISRWKRTFATCSTLLFMACFRLGSLLLPALEESGVRIRRFPIITPSSTLDREKILAIMATNDLALFPPPSLDSKQVSVELRDTQDGIVLINDHAFEDEEDRRIAAFKSLLRAVRGENADAGRNLIAVVSDNAHLLALRLAPEDVFEVETEGSPCDASAAQLREISNQAESLFRLALQELFRRCSTGSNPFGNFINRFRSILPPDLSDDDAGLVLLVASVELIFREIFQTPVVNKQLLEAMIEMFSQKGIDATQMILQDYSAAASEAFREGTLHAVRKRKNVPLPLNASTVLISGNRMFVSDRVLDLLIARMHTVNSRNSLIRALRESGNLVATDGDTHPIEVHDAEGKRVRLFWYDVAVELLDADVIHSLSNLDTLDFWMPPEEAPAGFIPLLSDGAGKAAGFQIAPKELENHSIFVSGQSGWGKSHTLAQLAAAYHAAGFRVIWLDASSSATEDALSRNLSPAYVRSNVQFFALDRGGIPVDLFHFDRSVSLSRQKRRLMGLLSAAVGDLSTPQSDVLQTAIMDLLQALDEHDCIQVADLMAMLQGSGLTFSSLRTRLEPLLDDIEHCGMACDGWEELLSHHGRFLVFETDSAFTENGNVLLDVVLASLFDFQMEHSDIPLAVILDEVQTQNVSANSPIRKVVSEGRKFRMSLIAASQDFPARSTDLGHVVGKIPTQIFLRPTLNAETTVASELRYSKAEASVFDSMQRGAAIAKGNFFNKQTGTNTPAILRGHVHRHCSPDEDSAAQGLPDRNGEVGTRDETDNAE